MQRATTHPAGKNTKRGLLTIVLAALLTLGAIAPAQAENYRRTYMKEVAVGFTSKTWQDERNDSVPTKITNRGCSLTFPEAHKYSSHNLQLQRKVNLGWHSHGARMSECSTVSWGEALKATWRFRVSQINRGNVETYQRLTVDSVVIYW